MGLFSVFKKEQGSINTKKYLAISDKRLDESDMLKIKELYEIIKKYQSYEKMIDLSNSNEVNNKISRMMSELFNLKILCKNYNEFNNLYYDFNVIKFNSLNILDCMVLLTYIQRQDYWSGGTSDVYFENTNNGIIPQLINRIISLYESRGK